MRYFPLCATQTNPSSALDLSKTLWLDAQLGDDSEPMFVLDRLEESNNNMVFGKRLRRFDTRGGSKSISVEE
jgi:hypothetical protein